MAAASRRNSEVICEINFDGNFTNEVRGKTITEIIKNIIYQRGQTPLPLEQLKRYVESVKASLGKQDSEEQQQNVLKEDSKSAGVNEPPTIENHNIRILNMASDQHSHLPIQSKHRKIVLAFESFTDLFERVSCVVGSINSTAKEVLLLIGGTLVTPREMFHLILPDSDKVICDKHEQILLSLRACMVRVFREVITKNALWEGGNTSITSVTVLVKISRDDQMSKNMEPLVNYKPPKKAAIKVIFPITNTCKECKTECVESDLSQCMEMLNTEENLTDTAKEDEEEPQFIWVRILPLVKGFSSSLLVTKS